MKPFYVSIPLLEAPCTGWEDYCQATRQPILCFKELEVDHLRYDAWKALVKQERLREEAREAWKRASKGGEK